ncbi:hypothetical protein OROMI_002888 [Orobanche minor]
MRSKENQHIFTLARFTDMCSTRSLLFFSNVDEVQREPAYIFSGAIYRSMFDDVRKEPAYIFYGAIYKFVFDEVFFLLLWHRRGPKRTSIYFLFIFGGHHVICNLSSTSRLLLFRVRSLVTHDPIPGCFLVCWRKNTALVVSSPDKLKGNAAD